MAGSKTVARGIRTREHETRKHGVGPDRQYFIRYRIVKVVDGEKKSSQKEEPLGWASEGWNLERAIAERAKLKDGHRDGQGPDTMGEKRTQAAKAKVEAERQQQLEAERNVTLADYWPVYLTSSKLIKGDKKKDKSWANDESIYANWLQPVLGGVLIKDIDVDHWDRLMGVMVDANLSGRTRQYAALVLRQVLAFAYSRKLVSTPPPAARDVGATIGRGGNRRTRTLSTAELQEILSILAERDPAAHAITLFCAMTGCRFGEAAGLEWRDLDLAVGEATFRATKNGKDRAIPLPPPLIAFLIDLRGQGRLTGPVFLNSAEKAYTQPPQPFRDVVEALGLNIGRGKRDRAVFHSLRHSAATRLAKAGTSLPDLQALCGWSSPVMALRYAHDDDKTKRKAMDALGNELATPSRVVDLFGK